MAKDSQAVSTEAVRAELNRILASSYVEASGRIRACGCGLGCLAPEIVERVVANLRKARPGSEGGVEA